MYTIDENNISKQLSKSDKIIFNTYLAVRNKKRSSAVRGIKATDLSPKIIGSSRRWDYNYSPLANNIIVKSVVLIAPYHLTIQHISITNLNFYRRMPFYTHTVHL